MKSNYVTPDTGCHFSNKKVQFYYLIFMTPIQLINVVENTIKNLELNKLSNISLIELRQLWAIYDCLILATRWSKTTVYFFSVYTL